MELQYLNQTYIQTGGLCIMAAYGIVLEYFSKSKYQIETFLKEYIDHFKPTEDMYNWSLEKGMCSKSSNKDEDMICAHYHYECLVTSKKHGLEFVKEIHTASLFKQSHTCFINKSDFQNDNFNMGIVNELKEDIKSGGLAVVYYQHQNGGHSVVLGYDNLTEKYFKRDPQHKEIIYGDFLNTQGISEYLLFSSLPSLPTL